MEKRGGGGTISGGLGLKRFSLPCAGSNIICLLRKNVFGLPG